MFRSACRPSTLALLLMMPLGLAAWPLAAAPPPTPPPLRLGDAARPLRYSATVRINPREEVFRASIDIELALREPTALLWLNGTELTVENAHFEVGGRAIAAHAVAGGEDFVGFVPAEPLPTGSAKLQIEYRGRIDSRGGQGLFHQQEDGRYYAATHFEPTDARRMFPCFDEPSFKVPWQLTLEVPKDEVALSNTPIASERLLGATKRLQFAPTKPLPSYLIAVAVGPFAVVDAGRAGKNRTPLRVAVPAGRAADASFAAQHAGEVLERLESYFGSPYPYEKLDLVSVPIFSGAMENAGLVTFGQQFLVAKPADRTLRYQRSFINIALHELAHHWFGNLVTTAWWDDIWLNEAFASWMTTRIVEEWKPEWNRGTALVDERERALGSDSLVSARQIRQPIQSRNDIFNGFDGITYAKGASVIAMFESWVGSEPFARAVRSYLAAHPHGNATAADFLAALSREAGSDLGPAVSTFLDQSGAPLLTMGLSCGSGKPKLELAVERYLPIGSAGARDARWQLPICVRYRSDGREGRSCTLLREPKGSLVLDQAASCPDWVVGNAAGRGYYRLSYRGDLRRRLLQNGGAALSLPELLALIRDSQALAQSGQEPLGTVLAELLPLAADPRRQVVQALVELVASLHEQLVSPAQRPSYVRLVQKLFGERARKLGFSPLPTDDEDTRLLRPGLLALLCDQGEDVALRKQAVELSRRWLTDRQAVSGELLSTVLSAAAIGGDAKLFDDFRAAAQRADRSDRQRLLSAMGLFREPAIASRALGLVLSGEFEQREAMALHGGTFAAPTTRPLGYEFLKQNWDTLVERLTPQRAVMLPFAALSFCDAAHRSDVESYFAERERKLPGGPRMLAQVLERMSLCVERTAAQRPSVAALLATY